MIIIKLERSDQHDERQCVTLKFSTVNCLWQCSLSVWHRWSGPELNFSYCTSLEKDIIWCIIIQSQKIGFSWKCLLLKNGGISFYHSLGQFSRWQIGDIFLIFPENRIWYFTRYLLRRQFAWKIKAYFLWKIRKIFQNVVCWNFYQACCVLTSVSECHLFMVYLVPIIVHFLGCNHWLSVRNSGPSCSKLTT